MSNRLGNALSVKELRNQPAAGAFRFSVAALARRWMVTEEKVREFIRNQELLAVNVASSKSSRPQWRISMEEVEKFERRRSSAAVNPGSACA
jgi:hypothetical protein